MTLGRHIYHGALAVCAFFVCCSVEALGQETADPGSSQNQILLLPQDATDVSRTIELGFMLDKLAPTIVEASGAQLHALRTARIPFERLDPRTNDPPARSWGLRPRTHLIDAEVLAETTSQVAFARSLGVGIEDIPGRPAKITTTAEVIDELRRAGLRVDVIRGIVALELESDADSGVPGEDGDGGQRDAPNCTYRHGCDACAPDFDICIPDLGYAQASVPISGAPANATVSSVHYIVDVNDPEWPGCSGFTSMWCSDMRLRIANSQRAYTIWDRQGGENDGGFDSDSENDRDIYLHRDIGTFFDGDPVNQTWYLQAWDLAGDDAAEIDQFEIWVCYETRADLYVNYIRPSQTCPQINQQFRIETQICNSSAATGDAGQFRIRYRVDGSTHDHDTILCCLSPGECDALGEDSGPYTIPEGNFASHTIEVIADVDNDIDPELNEGNNTASTTMYWGRARQPSADVGARCGPGNVSLTASENWGDEYDWQVYPPGGSGWTDIPGAQRTVTYNCSAIGMYDFRCRLREGSCWSDWSSSRSVSVDPIPARPGAPSASNRGPACPPVDGTLTGSSGYSQYDWQRRASGGGWEDFGGGNRTQSYSESEAGTWCFRYRVMSSASCWSDWGDEVCVVVNPVPTAPGAPTASNPSGCVSVSGILTGQPGFSAYDWQQQPPNAGWEDFGGSQQTQSYNATIPGEWHFHYRVRNPSGCWSGWGGETIVTVYPRPNPPNGPSANPTTICIGGFSLLTASADSGLEIQWFVGSCTGNPIATGSPIQVNPQSTTDYYVRTRDGSSGCTSECVGPIQLTVNTTPTTWYRDLDRDTYGDSNATQTSCDQPDGYVPTPGDCDDNDARVHAPPTVTDHPDNVLACPGDTATFSVIAVGALRYQWQKDGVDLFDDGHFSGTQTSELSAQSVTAADEGDYRCRVEGCPPSAASNTAELTVRDAPTWYLDADGDSFGNSINSVVACVQPPGYVPIPGDCNDNDPRVHTPPSIVDQPTDASACAGESATFRVFADQAVQFQWQKDGVNLSDSGRIIGTESPELRISGLVNSDVGEYRCRVVGGCEPPTTSDPASLSLGTARTWYFDADNDGYGDGSRPRTSCNQPPEHVSNGDDCNDSDPAIADARTWFRDLDEDGFGDKDMFVQRCERPAGYVANDDDCDDRDPLRKPDAIEVCGDGIDNNCDGQNDEGCDTDNDNDPDSSDCQPTNPAVHRGATEVCDGIDNDCDGQVDEGCPPPPPSAPPIAFPAVEIHRSTATKTDVQVLLDGRGSIDPDGVIVSFVWSENGRVLGRGALQTVRLTWAEHLIELTVTDNVGRSNTATVFVDLIEIRRTEDLDDDGYSGDSDCDPLDESVNPDAAELCDDGIDNNCDGLVDCDDPTCKLSVQDCGAGLCGGGGVCAIVLTLVGLLGAKRQIRRERARRQ